MVRLILFAIVVAVAAVIWIGKALAGAVTGSEQLRQETLQSQTQKTMHTTARGVNWLNEQWEQAKIATRSNPATDLALRIQENMLALERAADASDWKQAAIYAGRQDQLLALYVRCEGSSDDHLEQILSQNHRIRSLGDPAYRDWICDELFKRGLQPN